MYQDYNIDSLQRFNLGRQGENAALTIRINLQSWLTDYPNAQFYLVAVRPTEKTPYFVDTTFSDGILCWNVLAADLSIPGTGMAEIRAVEGDVIKKSKVFQTVIVACLPGTESEDPPENVPSWVDEILALAVRTDIYTKTETNALLGEKVDKTALETKLAEKISLDFNSSTYVMTLKYTDDNNTAHMLGTVDLPLESILLGASISGNTLTLTFKLGNDEEQSVTVDLTNMISAAIANKADKSDTYTKTEVDDALSEKQDILTFDDAPTANSNNPVKSSGVKTAIDNLRSEMPFKAISAPESTTLTDAEKAAITSGAYVESWQYFKNAVLFPAHKFNNVWYGLLVYGNSAIRWTISQYYINDTNNKFSYTDSTLQMESGRITVLNNKTIPNYPSSTGTFDFESVDGTLSWVQRVIDSVPTANSNNPISSGGVKTALDEKADKSDTYTKTEFDGALSEKQDILTFDDAPTANSNNPVKSSGVKTAIDGKQDTLTFDNTPTTNSNNLVKSGAIKTAIDAVENIAKGSQQSMSFANYSSMISVVNAASNTDYVAGRQNFYIITVDVPDLWVSSVESSSVVYTYTTDAAFTTALKTDGYVQVGYYKLSALETGKVDLSDYYTQTQTDNLLAPKLTEPASNLAVGKYFRIASIDADGHAVLECVDAPTAPVQGVSAAGTTLTPDANGIVDIPIAGQSIAGVIKMAGADLGVQKVAGGFLALSEPPTSNINNHTGKYYAVTINKFDYALKRGMCDGIAPAWSSSEQLAARQRMGIISPVSESYTIATSDWSALSSSSPYTYSATVTATHTIGNDTEVELINDQAILFATYGFVIGSVSGQSVTIYSIEEPSANVTLEVVYRG